MAIQIIQGWTELAPADRGAAIALGNFDGVHRGHRAVIGQAVEAARRLGVTSGVISFEPHPRRYFQPDAEPFRLMTVAQQARALEALGVDRLYLLPFDERMASLSDRAFAEQVLSEGLRVRHVSVGFDITFGKGRTGSPEALKAYGEELGFTPAQARQLAIQSQQQQLQLQQQRIDSGAQLANQLGPAMLRDLAALQLQNKNQKIADLLKKYGVEARAEQAPAKPASTPAPTPAAPADKKP